MMNLNFDSRIVAPAPTWMSASQASMPVSSISGQSIFNR